MSAIRGNGLLVTRHTRALRGSPPALCRTCGREIETFATVQHHQAAQRLWQHVDPTDCMVGVPWNDADAELRLARNGAAQ